MEFLTRVVLRCPVYAFGKYMPEKLGEVLEDPCFQAALYLASTDLWQAVKRKGSVPASLSKRERLSLLRYYNRMCFRPTPFGAFASFSVTSWRDAGVIELEPATGAHLHLDADQELRLALALDPWQDRSFRPNPALYALGKTFRYIRTKHGRTTSYELDSIPRTPLLERLLTGGIKNRSDLLLLIAEAANCGPEEALDYLRFLVDAGVLLPQHAPGILSLDDLKGLTAGNGGQGLPDSPAAVEFPDHRSLVELGEKLRTSFPSIKNPFYAGLEGQVRRGGLPASCQEDIQDGLAALQRLVLPGMPPALDRFIQAFRQRFDRQKVPLLLALDPDAGIAYADLSAPATETGLLSELVFDPLPSAEPNLSWTPVHRLLLQKMRNNSGAYDPVVLNGEDLRQLPQSASATPPSLAVLFRVLKEGIYLESVGGASATALTGRFTPWSDEVHAIGLEIARREEQANPDVLFADIGLLAEGHTDNINRRKAVYSHELPINVISEKPENRQIPLSDLWVSVDGAELVLESASLNKVVIPRLSSAYNYQRNPLAVFRLLCDLQYQGIQGNFTLDIEQLFPGLDFYPRVAYKGTLLCLAKWCLNSQTLQALRQGRETHWEAFRRQQQLPNVVALCSADRHLVFRLDKPAEVNFLLDCLHGLEYVVLQEYPDPSGTVRAADGHVHVNQFLAGLARKDAVYTTKPAPATPFAQKQAVFMPGSRWLYFKIYVSPALADQLLVNKLFPLLKRVKKYLLSWFFVRYRDPCYHIRLRLQLPEAAAGELMRQMKRAFGTAVRDGLIRSYGIDTYCRELERYSPGLITLVEACFYRSSELVLHYLKVSRSPAFGPAFYSLSLISVNQLMQIFLPEQDEQLLFLKKMTNTFYAEFASDKKLRLQLDRKYRTMKSELNELLTDTQYYRVLKLQKQANRLESKVRRLAKASAAYSEWRREQLLADLIHLHLNRLFADQQRRQELVVYYFLFKWQTALKVRTYRFRRD